MPLNVYRPRPGRHGVFVVYIPSKEVNALTSAGTDTVRIPTPFNKCYFLRASIQAQVAPVVTTGTSTATVKKFQASDGTTKTLTAGFDAETLTANKASPIALASGLIEGDRYIRNTGAVASGDTLFVEFVNGTTIATPPTAMYVVCELAVIN